MRKLLLPLGMLVVCGIAGCSEDPNDGLISTTISRLNQTTQALEEVNKSLKDAVAQAKNTNQPLDLVPIGKATDRASEIKQLAQDLQRIKAQVDVRKESITAEQREEYAKKYKASFQQALQNLDVAQKNLEATLREGDAVANPEGKSALEKLRETIKESLNEFEVLTKRQS
jgi:outer membrane murein-binding lipoprotein Lpp